MTFEVIVWKIGYSELEQGEQSNLSQLIEKEYTACKSLLLVT